MVPCSLTTHVKIWRWASVVFMPRSLYPSPRQRPVTKGTACPSSQARGFPRNHCVPSFCKPLWLCGTKLWLPWFFPEICPHLQDVCITRLPEPAREALRLGRHSPSGTWSAETRAALLTVDQEAGWRRRLSAQDASRRPWKEARLSVHASLPPTQRRRSPGVGPCGRHPSPFSTRRGACLCWPNDHARTFPGKHLWSHGSAYWTALRQCWREHGLNSEPRLTSGTLLSSSATSHQGRRSDSMKPAEMNGVWCWNQSKWTKNRFDVYVMRCVVVIMLHSN